MGRSTNTSSHQKGTAIGSHTMNTLKLEMMMNFKRTSSSLTNTLPNEMKMRLNSETDTVLLFPLIILSWDWRYSERTSASLTDLCLMTSHLGFMYTTMRIEMEANSQNGLHVHPEFIVFFLLFCKQCWNHSTGKNLNITLHWLIIWHIYLQMYTIFNNNPF